MWKRYVAYLVTEDVVGSCRHEDEIYTLNLFRVYTKSRHLLTFLATGQETQGRFALVEIVGRKSRNVA